LAIAGLIVMEAPYRLAFFLGIVMQLLVVMLLVGVGQTVLLRKTKKRSVLATSMIMACVILPLILLAMEGASPELYAAPWLWTITPIIAANYASIPVIITTILGQMAAIAVMHQLIQQRIKRIGASELRQLLDAQQQPTA
jgi:hypothetical protein